MVQLLDEIRQGVDRRESPFANDARVAEIIAQGPGAGLQGRMTYQGQLSEQLLYAGRFAEAADSLSSLLAAIDDAGMGVPAEFRRTIAELRASVYLKWAEQQACVDDGQVDRCLFPVRGEDAGPGAQIALEAVRAYAALLEEEPGDAESRWLMNIAAMLAGTYPGGLPDGSAMPPDAFRSTGDVGRFVDRAADVGLAAAGHAGGAILDDFDRDGDLDAMLSGWLLEDPLLYFENVGGRFEDRTSEAGLDGFFGGLNMKHADYDNDGFLDVLVLRGAWLPFGHPNSLLRNRGDGSFEDVTEVAGLLDPNSSQTADWADFDGDGWIDLYVGNESSGRRRTPNQLFHNQGDGTFRNIALGSGADVVGFVKGVAWGDYDNDGDPDLYVSRMGEPNVLLRNEGPSETSGWLFRDVTEEAGVSEPVVSFPVWFWDYDNDGWLDLYASAYRAEVADVAAEYLGQSHSGDLPALYRNAGDGTFRNVAEALGVDRIQYAMGANYGDLDADGFLDFYVGTGDPGYEMVVPNRAFRNAGGRAFEDVTTSGGFGHIQKGHAIAFGDVDADGDQDILVNMGGATQADRARNVLFENPGQGNASVTLRLEGTDANRAAIGARIRVELESPEGVRTVHAVVSGGSSFGANSLQQVIGVGRATAIREVQVEWPGIARDSQTFSGVGIGGSWLLRQGTEAPIAQERVPVPLGTGGE